jgi:hypothetical protein
MKCVLFAAAALAVLSTTAFGVPDGPACSAHTAATAEISSPLALMQLAQHDGGIVP